MCLFFLSILFRPSSGFARTELPCLEKIPGNAGFLVVDSDGTILAQQHPGDQFIPASTLKIVTALAAIHYLGPSYRFKTLFYLTPGGDLLVKGYGDPFLISEYWQDIARHISKSVHSFRDLLLDDSFFSPAIKIPGQGRSKNPYDAPPCAVCANFNTVFFARDARGRIVSAEPQTPMIPFAREKIRKLGEKKGRFAFSHDRRQALLYAGELFSFFLKKNGVLRKGSIRSAVLHTQDRLIYTHASPLTLREVIREMFKFSNNFVANQLLLAAGATTYGGQATLQKGLDAFLAYVRKELGLRSLEMVEGSGISRRNHISPRDMLTVLRRFSAYRDLLPRNGSFHYKTGTLRGIRTRAGYYEKGNGKTGFIVLFLKSSRRDVDMLVRCFERLF
jgi:serine-type D-Ala-D-Ala carboxypeptidase/endopeptidase (penicillin-binding protein 4)